jgi:IclR family pca regulon transcriptional regulator
MPRAESSEEAEDRDFVRALARGLAVIESFDDARAALTLSDVARRTQLSRGTAARVLHTLERLGYLRSDGRHFSLLPRTLKLGYAYLSSQPLWRFAHPMLEAVAKDTGNPCSLSVLDDEEIIYVTWVSAGRVVFDYVGVGGRLPAFCASMGRVLLADMPDAALDAFLAKADLTPRTPETITDKAKLRSIIAAVRRNGYGTQDEEVEVGQRAVAVPVKGPKGDVAAAINVTVAAHRYTMKAMIEMAVPVLRREAKRLGEALALVPAAEVSIRRARVR